MNARHITTLTLKQARRVAIFVVGGTVALLGVVMLITPGPGLALIVAGLAILAIEFAWARYLLADAKVRMQAAGRALRKHTGRGEPAAEARDGAPGGSGGPGLDEPAQRAPAAERPR